MNQKQVEQLDKLLALADSNHEGEALVAVRKARQILSRDGLSFSDLAKVALPKESRFSFKRSFFSSHHVQLEAQISSLQKILDELRADNKSLKSQVDFWSKKAFDLEQQLNSSMADAQRWKQLAKETAEKLWDISKIAEQAVLEKESEEIKNKEKTYEKSRKRA